MCIRDRLNTDTVSVSALPMLIAACPAVPRYISVLYALPYLPVKPYKIMSRGVTVSPGIILAIFLCAAQCAYVMNYNVFNA